MRRSLFIALVVLSTSGSTAAAQDEFLHLGARALGMGGAFTAVADDFTAAYWNPAGYRFGPIADVGVTYGAVRDRDGGDGDSALAVGAGFTFMGVAGISTRQRVTASADDGPRPLETFDLAVSILQSLPLEDLVVAANLHYLSAGFEGLESSGHFTIDAAALYEPLAWFRAGVMVRRLIEPELTASPIHKDADVFRLERHARFGLSFALSGTTRVAFDVDLSRQSYGREVALGVEKAFRGRAFSIRGGLRADQGSELGARTTAAFGASARIRWFVVDVAYETSADERQDRFFFGVALPM